jgi:sensor domain CHASE-containing protein
MIAFPSAGRSSYLPLTQKTMKFLFLIPAAIFVLALFLAWTDQDSSAWTDEEYEEHHRDQ